MKVQAIHEAIMQRLSLGMGAGSGLLGTLQTNMPSPAVRMLVPHTTCYD